MIITRPRGAIVTNPARLATADLNQQRLRYSQPLERSRPHQVELYARVSRRLGEDR